MSNESTNLPIVPRVVAKRDLGLVLGLVKLFIKHGAYANACDSDGKSPLYMTLLTSLKEIADSCLTRENIKMGYTLGRRSRIVTNSYPHILTKRS